MTAPVEILRDRLITALRSVETAAPRLQVPYGAMADAVLRLGVLESRWEIRGGNWDDRWFAYRNTREQAEALAAEHDGAEVYALYSLKFTPISTDAEEAK